MSYYLARDKDWREENEPGKKNIGSYRIFRNQPVPHNNRPISYPMDVKFNPSNGVFSKEVQEHCHREFEEFTGFKMTGGKFKKIKKMRFLKGGNKQFVIRYIDRYDSDIVVVCVKVDGRAGDPKVDSDGNMEISYEQRQLCEFNYDEWLAFSKIPMEMNEIVHVKRVVFSLS